MKIKAILLVMVGVMAANSGSAQFNEYKYIIVPKKFDAYRKPNQHQTSTLVKYMLTQHGFNVVYDDALPPDVLTNRCLALMTDVEDTSSMFNTKLSILFKDCKSNEVFRTIEGTSRSKEFKEAYKEAIKMAFVSFDAINYTYKPSESTEVSPKDEPIKISFKDDVKTVEEEKKSKVIEQEATPENQTYKSVEPTPSNYTKAESSAAETLYAQPIENGFQLVDSTPEIRLILVKSSLENVFLVQGGPNGIVYQKEDTWWWEHMENGNKKLEQLNIKF
ncbi:hypothetical protein EW142_07780 [Flagellimonas allohymeniacidonis]|uniref:DUF4174 domain-containing protein n=2 Tax=Flagellimonas allohymeniacidonis TaxID=2517819 RepID=A0A4Q8QN01_9FLAO|nr:hypothetical protein EW142_07780 [Allomuricauda hymeniacidonis]